jgi:hypothetical protein
MYHFLMLSPHAPARLFEAICRPSEHADVAVALLSSVLTTPGMCLALLADIFRRVLHNRPRLPILIPYVFLTRDRLCGLVVRVRGYRSRDPWSIPGAT